MPRAHEAEPTVGADATVAEQVEPIDASLVKIGAHVGRYVVVAEIGRGGMGVVHRAYDPKLRREVALKVLRAGGSREASVRMLREAQAMARLSHPNIVAVYDADEHEGEPYIAMELVEGHTLSKWLAAGRGWREILDVLVAAGTGLAAAHAAGIVHRDFKPSNTIVGEHGRVWVTDFGIARAIFDTTPTSAPSEQAPGEDETLTSAGTVVGTPAYLAPEVHQGAAADLRSDLYSFCVTAWEAWYGKRPFEGSGAWALLEAKRRGAPPAPEGVGVPRRIYDVLARGLDPDPNRRPPSMPGLLAELTRDPWRRRRRVLLGAGVLAGAGVIAIAQVWQARDRTRACREEGEAITNVWNADTRARVEAGVRSSGSPIADTTAMKLLVRLDDYAARWRVGRTTACEAGTIDNTWTADLLERSRACYDAAQGELSALIDGLAEGGKEVTIRAVPAASGLTRPEDCSDENQLALRVEPEPAIAAQVTELRAGLVSASTSSWFGHTDDAARVREEVLAQAEALGFAPLVAQARIAVGESMDARGEFAAAERSYEQAFHEAVAAGADVHAYEAATSLVTLVGHRRGQHERGLAWARTAEAFARRIELGADDSRRAVLWLNTGNVHTQREDHVAARDAYLAAIEISESVFGADHPAVASALINAAAAETALGHLHEARALLARAEAAMKAVFGEDHPDVGLVYFNFGNLAYFAGDYAEALEWMRKSVKVRSAALGPAHPDVNGTKLSIAVFTSELGRHEEALAIAEDAERMIKTSVGVEHPLYIEVLHNLGLFQLRLRNLDEAQAYGEAALAAEEKLVGPEHSDVANTLSNLAIIARQRGDLERALTLHERALAVRTKLFGESHADTANSMGNLANVLADLGRVEEALAMRQRSLAIEEAVLGPEHPALVLTLLNLGQVLTEMDRAGEAVPLLERGLVIADAQLGPEHPHAVYTLTELGKAELAIGHPKQALAHLERAHRSPVPDGTLPADAAELDEMLASARARIK